MRFTREIKIGIIVFIGIAGLVWGVPFLKGTDIFSNQKKIYAIYSRVDGVTPSLPVLISGLKIGQVEKLKFSPDKSGKVIIEMIIDGNVFIPKKSEAQIVSTDLLGSKAIEIHFNTKESRNIENKDTLVGATQSSITDEVNEQLAPLKQRMENILGSADSVLRIVNNIFNERSQNDLRKSVESIGNTIRSIEGFTQQLNSYMQDETGTLKGITEDLSKITSTFSKSRGSIENAVQNLSQFSDTLVKSNIGSTIRNTDKVLKQTAQLMDKINKGQGSLGQLATNDSLYRNLNNVSRDLDNLIKDLKERPGRYVRLSLFGGGKKNQ